MVQRSGSTLGWPDQRPLHERSGGKFDGGCGQDARVGFGRFAPFATGISTTQTWAKQLELQLNAVSGSNTFRTFNAGTTGYSLHQYLCRLRDDGPRLKPHYVVVGLSYATDFYDVLPPGRGGGIYGGDRERDYFDLDDQGKLVGKHWVPARKEAAHNYGKANPLP